jgi:hypothetical protein
MQSAATALKEKLHQERRLKFIAAKFKAIRLLNQ